MPVDPMGLKSSACWYNPRSNQRFAPLYRADGQNAISPPTPIGAESEQQSPHGDPSQDIRSALLLEDCARSSKLTRSSLLL